MTSIANDTIKSAVQIIGTTRIEDDEIERRVRRLVSDDLTARRLIDWIPEAFGLVHVSHFAPKIILPTTFSAKSRNGAWVTLKLTAEPIFTSAVPIAQQMFHEGPREVFQNVSLRSSVTTAVNNGLKDGASLEGGSLSGPALIGIPAEVYATPPKSFWERLFSR